MEIDFSKVVGTMLTGKQKKRRKTTKLVLKVSEGRSN